MHEYYITEEIIRIACETAKQHQAPSISKINIVIGELAGIVPDSISFYFDVLARGTEAAGAVLNFTLQPVSRLCLQCGVKYQGVNQWDCPACGGSGKILNNGRDFYIDSVHLPD